jgi:starvation-inducible DNA-binding protein
MKMQTGMNDKNRKSVSEGLTGLLADTYAVYLKTQNFHWNIAGTEFYSLHVLLEKQYTEMAEAIDEIAERIRALGFHAPGSFSSFKKLTSIPEEEKVPSAKTMIQKLIQGHEILVQHARKLAQVAEKEQDPATVDLMGRRLNAHEKFLWMLRSQL